MVDRNIARWVKEHHSDFSLNRGSRLTPFKLNYSSLRYNNFDNYLHWVRWCRDTAGILTDRTSMQRRARDVEIAVFTAAREGLSLASFCRCSTRDNPRDRETCGRPLWLGGSIGRNQSYYSRQHRRVWNF